MPRPTLFFEFEALAPDGWGTLRPLGGMRIGAENEDTAVEHFDAWARRTWPEQAEDGSMSFALVRITELRWPQIFPEVPREITDAMSLWHTLATDAAGRTAQALAGEWPGNPGIAQGQAMAFEAASYHLAEDLARGAWYEGADALKWTRVR